ncbi:MAG: UvrD-helicase domain-containing protein [Pirellulaceae bacterium]|nr:UvrD-helicase domain-containing protein [Pirellulaceae bacterium]
MSFGGESPLETDLFAALTAAQREAVAHVDGPLLILAGPGSGKTRVVTHRVANLMRHGIPPYQILALTFTNKAADEMRQRVQTLTGSRDVWMGTFHGFCARLLRIYATLAGLQENFSIYDSDDSLRVLKQAMSECDVQPAHTSPGSIAHAISWAKNHLIRPDEYVARQNSPTGMVTEKLYPVYQRLLLEANAVDFDDLLLHVAIMLRENDELRAQLDDRYRYILVDEYQDTNLAQYALVRALSINYPNLAVTGDPDQSIYGWRGADLNNILDFERDMGAVRVVRLEENFRSTPNILRVADHLISYNVKRKPKKLYTSRPEGSPVRLIVYPTGHDEADGIAARIADEIREGNRSAGDFAVFYRVNALSRQLEHAMRSAGIPYQIVNGLEFYQRREIKDLLAYLHLLNNPRNNFALLRIVNTPPRGIGKVTIERLTRHARQRGISLLDAARESGLIESIPKRTAAKIAAFVAACDRMAEQAFGDVRDAIQSVLEESGYRRWLIDSGTEEDQERLANIEELLTAAEEFDHQHPEEQNRLERFLEQSSLVADTDAWEEEAERITMMTLHAAKGLEFPVVYIVAIEEGLLPHQRSSEDPDKLEEERRLLFVGMTRAREELQLSLAQYRAFRGDRRPTIPSQFLMELPREQMAYSEPTGYCDDTHDASFDVDGFDRGESVPPVWTDDEFVQESPDEYETRRLPSGVTTAAEMLQPGRRTGRRYPPATFFQGLAVSHPEYGSGMIVAVSGQGAKRTARVYFYSDGEERSFLLAHSPLVPEGDEF